MEGAMQRQWLMVTAAVLLSGCATRGPITLACPIFDQTVFAAPPSRLERDIQADAGGTLRLAGAPVDSGLSGMAMTAPPAASNPPSDPLRDAFRQPAPAPERSDPTRALAAAAPRRVSALLLSGGGQWGAFGAGFLGSLQASGQAIDPDIVTGVSTGGLQSLFATIGTPDAYARLLREYSPASQKELVTTNSLPLTALTGSMAGIKPLRRAIERSLCSDGDPARGCPMIDDLAASRREAFIGFVEAKSGKFMIARVKEMARHGQQGAPGTPARIAAQRTARDCLTGVALASAGMPLFFQPVRIKRSAADPGRVYYDGGVRQSVFLATVAEAAADSTRGPDGRPVAPPPTLYVIRNGPTQLLGADGTPGDNEKVDTKFDALTAALRAQSIIVNQVEIGSIAALRLFHPTGDIFLATADGYQNHMWAGPDGQPRRCDKGEERFFNPDFMACLRSLGRTKAQREAPWLSLSETGAR
jgi:predicted acylesterase/phospholipase RssA